MYIDFMDTLRNIQSGIYPQIKTWYVEMKDSIDKNNLIKDDIILLQKEVKVIKCETQAIKFEAQSWANEDEDVPVKEFYCKPECGTLLSTDRAEKEFSAKHYSVKSKKLSQLEKWEAMAAQMTAWSFANEEYGTFVTLFTSMDNGYFREEILEDVYSAKHYAQDTEKLSGQMRWVETQEALQCQRRFEFSKDINDADVYINGIRQINHDCYEALGNVITFHSDLNDKDQVTVSGMEAITSDYYQHQIDKVQKLSAEAKYAKCLAEAAQKTAQSFTSEAIGQTVKIYTADKNCGIKISDTTVYSTLHWSSKITELKSGIMVLNLYSDLEHMNPSDATTVYLRGGLTINDGRHGMFIYDHTHTCTNNGGTVINGFVRQYDGPVDVRWFLAEGDGINNDTTSILKAIMLKEDLLFPSGSYLISSFLVFENIRVEASQVTFIADIKNGRAITCQNMGVGQGIIGSAMVNWYSHKTTEETVSFFIQGCDDARFDIGSKDATIGIQLDPEFGHTINNIFNLKLMKNNTVGVYIGDTHPRYASKENHFNYGEFIFDESLRPTMSRVDIASFIYVEKHEDAATTFNLPGFTVSDRKNDDFQLFRLHGNDVYLKPAYANIVNNGGVFGIVSGRYATLDFTLAHNLVHYKDFRFGVGGYVGNINASLATDLEIIGLSNLTTVENKTFEVFTDGAKPSYTIANESGLGLYMPSDDKSKLIELEDILAKKSLFLSPWEIDFKDQVNGDETLIKNGSFTITDGKVISMFDKQGFRINVLDPALPYDDNIGFIVEKGDIKTQINTNGVVIEDNSLGSVLSIVSDHFLINSKAGDSVSIDSSEIKLYSRTDVSFVSLTKDKVLLDDGARSVDISPEKIEINGKKKTNQFSLNADGIITALRKEDKQNVMTLTNNGRGGVLLLEVPERDDAALRISANGKSVTEIRSGDTWVADGKKIRWHGLYAPDNIPASALPSASTAYGKEIWEVGDIIFGDEPIVNGNIGWVCVQQGRPGKWKAWGKVDIFNHLGDEWRNEEVDFYAMDKQADFLVVAKVFKTARVLINGIKLKRSEYKITDSVFDTLITLNVSASKDDWISIEY